MLTARWVRRWGPAVVAGLYLLSMVLPAIDQGPSDPPFPSGEALGFQVTFLGGILLLATGLPQMIPVLANPVHWIGWVLLVCGRRRGAAVAGILGLLLALSALFMPMGTLLIGYYVWLISMAALAVAGLVGRKAVVEKPA
jgi:hypothetical protein